MMDCRRLRGAAALLLAALLPTAAQAGGSTPPGIVQSGTVTPGNCAQFSANGVAIDAGATCGTGTSGVSQATGTASQILINGNAAAHTGAVTFSLPPGLSLGAAAGTTGSLALNGATSGTVTIQPQAAAGTYNFNLPTSAGTAGQALLSGGGAGAAMTFGSVAVAGGGTGLASGTSGGILGFTAAGTIASSAALGANQLVLGGGAGATPTALGGLGTTTTVLHGNASGAPSFAAVNLTTDVSGLNPVTTGGTGAGTLTAHGVLLGEGTAPIAATTAMTNGQLLIGATGADPAPQSLSQDCTVTSAGVLTCLKTNNVAFTAAATTAIGTSGATLPKLDGANTWSATQTFAKIGGYLANVVTDATTARTLSSTDCGTFIAFTNASAIAVTLPNSLSAGCQVAFEQFGAGQLTLTAASGAVLHSAHSFTKSFGQFAVIGVTVDGNSGGTSAVYVMTGDGA